MKINDVFSVVVCIVEIKPDGYYGDVYTNLEHFTNDHPNSSFKFGYCVVDQYGNTPPDCNDWNDSPEEAVADFRYNCTSPEDYANQYKV